MQEKSSVTMGELMGYLKKRIWYVLGAALLAAVLAAVAVYAVIDPMLQSYRLTFRVVYPASETMKYPDGSPFSYQQLVTESALEEAKASDERFSKINVEGLVEKHDISISLSTDADGARAYLLTAKASRFKNAQTATAFLKTVAGYPARRIAEAAAWLDLSVDCETEGSAFNVATYSARISLLKTQKENILAQYDGWIETLGGGYRVEGGNLLSHRAQAAVAFDEATQASLAQELALCGYVPVDRIAAARESLAVEYSINENIIEALKSAMQTIGTSALSASPAEGTRPETAVSNEKTLASLITRNEEIRYMLGSYAGGIWTGGALTEANVRAFENKLSASCKELNEAAATLRAVSASLYAQETHIYFETAKAEKEGGIGLLPAAVLGGAVGLLAAAVIVCAVEYGRASKRAAEGPAEAEEGAAEGAPAEKE